MINKISIRMLVNTIDSPIIVFAFIGGW